MTHDPASKTPSFPDPGPHITAALFREWRSPRFGRSNPERLSNPVWEWLVRSGATAYAADRHFGYVRTRRNDPGWSFARFGQTVTPLDDGREICIAGEHEDFYDPDFCIYNDIVVRYPDGHLDIFGYPRESFPPTDFHTATSAGDRLVIIGNLGFPSDRLPGITQVLVLDPATLSVAALQTTGEAPGWIHGHAAALADSGSAIVISGGRVETGHSTELDFVENGDDWRLDLDTRSWQRLTDRGWQQWQVARVDGRPSQLWQLRSLLQFRGVRWAQEHREAMEAMIARQVADVRAVYGGEPDLDLFASLFVPHGHDEVMPDNPDEFGVHRIRVGGVVVRYVERRCAVNVIAEGRMPESASAALVEELRRKLSTLEHADYVVASL